MDASTHPLHITPQAREEMAVAPLVVGETLPMSELVHAIRHDNTFLLMHYPVVEGVDEKLPGNALHITHSDTIAFLRSRMDQSAACDDPRRLPHCARTSRRVEVERSHVDREGAQRVGLVVEAAERTLRRRMFGRVRSARRAVSVVVRMSRVLCNDRPPTTKSLGQ